MDTEADLLGGSYLRLIVDIARRLDRDRLVECLGWILGGDEDRATGTLLNIDYCY